MAWIESHQELERHPKVLQLVTLTGRSLNEVLGMLHRFWWWCVDYAEDGDLRKFNDDLLGSSVGLNGDDAKRFIEALTEARWLCKQPYFRVHDWWNYIGRFLQVRYKHYPEKWKHIKQLYERPCNCSKNGSKGGAKNYKPNLTKPNLTKENNKKKRYGEFSHVLLSDEEHKKLLDKFNGSLEEKIKKLDEGIELKGYKYKSHYMAILKWDKTDQGGKIDW